MLAPSLSCTMQAVLGKIMSGVVVATTIRSMSAAVSPAASSARRPALTARSLVSSLSAAMRRDWMPERVRIHSSEVSTNFARSSLVRIFPADSCRWRQFC